MAQDIFDAFNAFSEKVHRADEIRTLTIQANACRSRRCGNCYWWMKRECKPEKIHKQLKSMNSPACEDFNHDPAMEKIALGFDEKINALKPI